MSLCVYHDPGFAAPIGKHVMPIQKFALVSDEIRRQFPDIPVISPQPVSETDLLRVHTREYVTAIRSGEPRALAESQKFPWTPELYPSVLLTNGGLLAAARQALRDGACGALASGFHHSCSDHGEGFCTFNGLVVTLEALRAEGKINTGAVLDMDLHYGNGTANLAETRPWISALSIYGNDYAENIPYSDVSTRHHTDGVNHVSAPLAPSGDRDGAHLLALLEKQLPWLIAREKPDILLYQAGADPLHDDPYSPLNLHPEDLYARDLRVFEFCKSQKIPVAWVLAGGYAPDISRIVEVHVNTCRAYREIFG